LSGSGTRTGAEPEPEPKPEPEEKRFQSRKRNRNYRYGFTTLQLWFYCVLRSKLPIDWKKRHSNKHFDFLIEIEDTLEKGGPRTLLPPQYRSRKEALQRKAERLGRRTELL
jgi:hypothetical protein